MLLLAQSVLLTANAYRRGPILGIRIGKVWLHGSGKDDIRAAVLQALQAPLSLRSSERTFIVTPSDVGVKVNVVATLRQLNSYGRVGSVWRRVKEQDLALVGLLNARLSGSISRSLLSIKVLEISDGVNRNPLPPLPDFAGVIEHTLPARDGVATNVAALSNLIAKNIFNPPAAALLIPTEKVVSVHTEGELGPIRAEAIARTKEPITIISASTTFTLTPQDLRQLLTVVERPDPKNPKVMRLSLRLYDVVLNRKLEPFARAVEAKTGAEFDDHDARVALYSQFYSPGPRHPLQIPTGGQITLESLKQSDIGYMPPAAPAGLSRMRPEVSPFHSVETANILDTFRLAQSSQNPVPSADEGQGKWVYLTFDDGPNAVYHPLILDILKKYNVQATFFLVGDNARRYDAVTKRTLAEGHEIGNHSLTHAFLPHLPPAKIAQEVEMTTDILNTFTTTPITFFRPPYGGVNPSVKKEAKSQNLKLTLWTVDPRDWSEPSIEELVSRVVSNVTNGSDILLHSNHLVTVKALPNIIEQLKERGYTFRLL